MDYGSFVERREDVGVCDFEGCDGELGQQGGRHVPRRGGRLFFCHAVEELCGVVESGLLCCRHASGPIILCTPYGIMRAKREERPPSLFIPSYPFFTLLSLLYKCVVVSPVQINQRVLLCICCSSPLILPCSYLTPQPFSLWRRPCCLWVSASHVRKLCLYEAEKGISAMGCLCPLLLHYEQRS